jgi:hypothetical protein
MSGAWVLVDRIASVIYAFDAEGPTQVLLYTLAVTQTGPVAFVAQRPARCGGHHPRFCIALLLRGLL